MIHKPIENLKRLIIFSVSRPPIIFFLKWHNVTSLLLDHKLLHHMKFLGKSTKSSFAQSSAFPDLNDFGEKLIVIKKE